jgi:hypothetical protein
VEGEYDVGSNQDMLATVYNHNGRINVETIATFETADLQLRDMDENERYNNLYGNGRWTSLDETMRLIQFHPDILVDKHVMARDEGLAIVQGIKDGTARIVSDRSNKKDTPIGPSGILAFRIAL